MSAQAAATEAAYVNGRIFTQDEDRPWAESLVTKGDRIVFVGSDEEALEHAAEDSKLVDLQGRFVMPGIIDAHTHPGLISVWGDLSLLDEAVGEQEDPAATCQGRREIRPLWRSKNRPVWRRSSGFRGTAGTEPEGALQGDLRRSGRRPTKTGASGGWVSRKSEIVSFDFV